MKYILKLIVIVCLALSSIIEAQVSNPGFETWVDGKPEFWNISNLPPMAYPVTQSTESHSGTYAIRGEVVADNLGSGELFNPIINSIFTSSSFPTRQRYASMELYYQFFPAGDDVMHIFVRMYKDDDLLGSGNVKIENAALSYTKLSVPIEYYGSGEPNYCLVIIRAGNDSDTIVGYLGTWFLVDDISFGGTTGIDDKNNNGLPEGFVLSQNYPNPFNPSTTIEFSLPLSSEVSLKIYDMLGQEVASLISGKQMSSGNHRIQWDAGNYSNGTYIYRLTAGSYSLTKKMILLK